MLPLTVEYLQGIEQTLKWSKVSRVSYLPITPLHTQLIHQTIFGGTQFLGWFSGDITDANQILLLIYDTSHLQADISKNMICLYLIDF